MSASGSSSFLSVSPYSLLHSSLSVFLRVNFLYNTDLALLQTATSNALPTIVQDLQGNDFVWVGSAYPLAATALLPMSGGVAEVRLPYHHPGGCSSYARSSAAGLQCFSRSRYLHWEALCAVQLRACHGSLRDEVGACTCSLQQSD